MLFSMFLKVFVHTKCYFFKFAAFSQDYRFFLSFYRLFSVFLQIIFNIFTGYFRKEKLTDIFQIFSMIILSFFKGDFQFTGYFFCFYRLFSIFLQVIFRITGFFSISTACLQYYRDLSLFLQVSSSILHVVFNFFRGYFPY